MSQNPDVEMVHSMPPRTALGSVRDGRGLPAVRNRGTTGRNWVLRLGSEVPPHIVCPEGEALG